jgi:hypothetical protein
MNNVAQLPQIDDDLYHHARIEYADRYANLAAEKRTGDSPRSASFSSL